MTAIAAAPKRAVTPVVDSGEKTARRVKPANWEQPDEFAAPAESPPCASESDECRACCPPSSCRTSGCDFGGWHGHWKSTCNLYGHFPYRVEPQGYYYFRPYNWFHIPGQQGEVQSYGGDPRHPYDNALFQNVYRAAEKELVRPPALP